MVVSNKFSCSPLFGEDFPFDEYFSDGLVQPPTRHVFWSLVKTGEKKQVVPPYRKPPVPPGPPRTEWSRRTARSTRDTIQLPRTALATVGVRGAEDHVVLNSLENERMIGWKTQPWMQMYHRSISYWKDGDFFPFSLCSVSGVIVVWWFFLEKTKLKKKNTHKNLNKTTRCL